MNSIAWQLNTIGADIENAVSNIGIRIDTLQEAIESIVGKPGETSILMERINHLEEENNELRQRLDQLEFLLQEN